MITRGNQKLVAMKLEKCMYFRRSQLSMIVSFEKYKLIKIFSNVHVLVHNKMNDKYIFLFLVKRNLSKQDINENY